MASCTEGAAVDGLSPSGVEVNGLVRLPTHDCYLGLECPEGLFLPLVEYLSLESLRLRIGVSPAETDAALDWEAVHDKLLILMEGS